HTSRHSPRILANPRSRNRRKPRASLIWPKTGSTITFRREYTARPAAVFSFACIFALAVAGGEAGSAAAGVVALWCRWRSVGGYGPGRPGWSPTQAPHRSGLAHHAHPVPHPMNSRPARSVVVTWTWFRSQCTWHVSLQRLMRRHPLPSTGSLGLVPPLQRYYEVLRLPAAHFAALRFLRLAIPSLRPLFVPPGPG